MEKSAVFKTIIPRLSIKYASVEVLGCVSNMPRSIPNMPRLSPTEAYLIARPTFISRLLVLLGVILVPVLMAAVFGQFSEIRAPSPPGRTHPRFKKNPRLLALSHAAKSYALKEKSTLIEVSA